MMRELELAAENATNGAVARIVLNVVDPGGQEMATARLTPDSEEEAYDVLRFEPYLATGGATGDLSDFAIDVTNGAVLEELRLNEHDART